MRTRLRPSSTRFSLPERVRALKVVVPKGVVLKGVVPEFVALKVVVLKVLVS
jgi:hypothetical protein